MTLAITTEVKGEMYTLERRLFLNADKTKVVEQGDPEARFVLGGEGSQIPNEDAVKYGLLPAKEAVKDTVPGEAKAVTEAPENKAVTMPKGKKKASE